VGNGFELSWSWLASVGATLVEGVAIACLPIVLPGKKEPAPTFPSLCSIRFVPIAGLVLSRLLGRDRSHRPVRHRAAVSTEMRSCLDDRFSGAFPRPHSERDAAIVAQPEEQQRTMRLAARIGRGGIRPRHDVHRPSAVADAMSHRCSKLFPAPSRELRTPDPELGAAGRSTSASRMLP
jgi:hypothetical protein